MTPDEAFARCDDDFQAKMAFMAEIDQLKNVLRKGWLHDQSRRENSAEHSWHIALMALLFADRANHPIDVLKTLKMILIHDIVEIDAGDTFLYASNRDAQSSVEQCAAERIFGLLPAPYGQEFMDLWQEFTLRTSPEARYAAAIDRMEPLTRNIMSHGRIWHEQDICSEQVLTKNAHIADGATDLWHIAEELLNRAIDDGHLKRKKKP